MLSVVEAVSVALVSVLLAPRAPTPAGAFAFRTQLGDIVLLSALRAALISATYAYGTHRQFLRCARGRGGGRGVGGTRR